MGRKTASFKSRLCTIKRFYMGQTFFACSSFNLAARTLSVDISIFFRKSSSARDMQPWLVVSEPFHENQ